MDEDVWIVRGGFNGSTEHDSEEEALAEYERVRRDSWSSKGCCAVDHVRTIISDKEG